MVSFGSSVKSSIISFYSFISVSMVSVQLCHFGHSLQRPRMTIVVLRDVPGQQCSVAGKEQACLMSL